MSNIARMMQRATAGAGGAGLDVDEVFSTFLYIGAGGTTATINNGIDLSGEGGLVWIKARNASENHGLFDTTRGVTKLLSSNTTGAETTNSGTLTNFYNNGFKVDGNGIVGSSTDPYVSWTFRKAPRFFDVVTYTGDGTNYRNISHNLGTTVGHVIVKKVSGGSAAGWINWHRTFSDYQSVFLNTTEAVYSGGSNGGVFGQASGFTSTQFQLGGPDNITYHNENGSSYVAYLFAHNNNDGGFGPSGDQDVIKCGSYTGNQNAVGPVIDLGFEPQWLMIKNTSATKPWLIIDVMRGTAVGTSNAGVDQYLEANTSDAEDADTYLSINSTGFQPRDTGGNINASGENYIYVAIRRGPLAAPTDATKVFTAVLGDGSGTPSIKTSNHVTDFGITFNKTGGGSVVGTRLLGTKQLQTHTTNAESNNTYLEWDFMNGWHTWTGLNTNYINWNWKRAPSYFDVCCYTGAGAAQTVNHNLGVVPEMMWIKNRGSAENWAVYHSALGTSKYLHLNTTDPALTTDAANRWNNTSPTATQFSVGTSTEVSHFTRGFVALLFATVAGVSKVGSYDGNGSNQNIDCGFSSGARFILIKSIQSGSWYVFDTVRGIVSGNDGHLKLNTNDAEAYADSIDTYSGGFNVVQNSTTDLNKGPSDESYIFYAIA